MDPLKSDPRTSGIGGSWAARRELARVAARLLGELRVGEQASWVATSGTMRPVLAVLTNHRLLAIPASAGQPVRAVHAPLRITARTPRMLSTALEITGSDGGTISLTLLPDDVTRIEAAAHRLDGAADAGHAGPEPHTPTLSAPGAPPRGSDAAWSWGRPVLRWQDAEQLAAAHLVALGFRGVLVTPGSGDGGRDVVAEGAAAQVKFHALPSGSPDVQRLSGAATGFEHKLFYAQAYSPAAVAEADRLSVGLFVFTAAGLVAPMNEVARQVAPRPATVQRTAFGRLTFESRQHRVLRWASEVQAATQATISNRDRKAAKQLAARKQALQLMLHGLKLLEESGDPIYQQKRKERVLGEAESTMRSAGRAVGLLLS